MTPSKSPLPRRDYNNFGQSWTILLIDGNDITSQTSPWELAHAIEALTQRVEDITRSLAIILTIKNRLQPQAMSCEQFRAIKNSTSH